MLKPIFELKTTQGIYRVFNQRPEIEFISVKQIHSPIIISSDSIEPDQLIEADGIVGNDSKVKCIFTADCLPIIVLGSKGHAIIHAGWKGIRDRILFDSKLDFIDPKEIIIGPHIHLDHYEVQEEFKKEFPQSKNFFESNGKIYFDLTKEVMDQAKLKNLKCTDTNICTFSNLEFHSYRRNKTKDRNYNLFFPLE